MTLILKEPGADDSSLVNQEALNTLPCRIKKAEPVGTRVPG